MSWNKVTLFKFQHIEAINAKELSEVDKLLFAVCAVFDMTEHQLDNTSPEKVIKLVDKVNKIFSSDFNPQPKKRIGKYFIKYDVSKMTLGQYIELAFFLQNPTQNAHYIIASVSNRLWRKNNSSQHSKKAAYFLKVPVSKIIGCVTQVKKSFDEFNKEYKGLFGLDKEVHNPQAIEDKFNKRYGWIYSASQVAEYERITLDAAFRLPIRQALNDLAYLKAKGKYESELLKRS